MSSSDYFIAISKTDIAYVDELVYRIEAQYGELSEDQKRVLNDIKSQVQALMSVQNGSEGPEKLSERLSDSE